MIDLIIIACPPYSLYKKAPEDQSHSELVDCPICKLKMWLSEKKKELILMHTTIGDEIQLICYKCFKKEASECPEFFEDSEIIKI
ncbi:MAG TPA: hypothetical protein VNZ46_10060 [Pedobacter sp.]|jgi:hypothetical protein|nr:hypothetical protein [Pedobacter sp.]